MRGGQDTAADMAGPPDGPFLARIPIIDENAPLHVCRLRPLLVDYSYLHRHPELELCYFPSDSGTFMIEDRELPISPGDLFIVNGNEIHQPILEARVNEGALAIYFRPAMLGQSAESLDLLTPFLFASRFGFNRVTANARLGALVEELHREAGPGRRRHPVASRGLLTHILSIIACDFAERCEAEGRDLRAADAHRFAPVVAHINRNLHRKIRAADLYGLAGLSHSQFCVAFRKAFAMGASEYIQGERIKRARRLLVSTSMTLTEVAFAVGFGSSSFFSTTFTRHQGMSPRRYRAERNRPAPDRCAD